MLKGPHGITLIDVGTLLCCKGVMLRRNAASTRRVTVRATAEKDDDVGALGLAAIAGGFVANPVVLWSLYTLKTTGVENCLRDNAYHGFSTFDWNS